MGPLTDSCPKPLLDLGGRPVITYVMDHLLSIGVKRFIINTHHRPEVYAEKFPERLWRGRPIIFRHEKELLDTGGGLKNIGDLIEEDETVICYNGDIFADLPLADFMQFHISRRPEATMVLRSMGPSLNVAFDGKGSICDIRNTLGNPGMRQCLFTGIYAVETSLLEHIETGRIESIITIFLNRIRSRPGSIAGFIEDSGAWSDIGSPQAYEELKHRIEARERQ